MCQLNERVRGKKRGWKVVWAEGGKYYSVAMGCKYPKDGKVPVVKQQRCKASHYFSSHILYDQMHGYAKDMVGRTAVYSSIAAASDMMHFIIHGCYRSAQALSQMRTFLRVVPAEVSVEVMRGTYGTDEVFAGRRIKFLKESKRAKAK